MNRFFIQRESELFCPICHSSENCKSHLVEFWEKTQRISHLANLLSDLEYPQVVYERIIKKFPAPEHCFKGSIIISWKTMFSNPPKEYTALFHQEGTQLLQRYKDFILTQLEGPDRIRNLLKKVSHKEQIKNPLDDDSTILADEMAKNLM